jgi:hypothetical protein
MPIIPCSRRPIAAALLLTSFALVPSLKAQNSDSTPPAGPETRAQRAERMAWWSDSKYVTINIPETARDPIATVLCIEPQP